MCVEQFNHVLSPFGATLRRPFEDMLIPRDGFCRRGFQNPG